MVLSAELRIRLDTNMVRMQESNCPTPEKRNSYFLSIVTYPSEIFTYLGFWHCSSSEIGGRLNVFSRHRNPC